MSRWQNVAPEMIMSKVRANVKQDETIFFLGCHQTPLRYFMHGTQAKVDYLDCSPLPVRNTPKAESQRYLDGQLEFVTTDPRGYKISQADWILLKRHDRDLNPADHANLVNHLEQSNFEMFEEPFLNTICLSSTTLMEDLNILLKTKLRMHALCTDKPIFYLLRKKAVDRV
jgi:hypothetical protein